MYTWGGMEKISFEEVLKRHHDGSLVGAFMLYPDGSEALIENDYDINDILNHHYMGGEFGDEKDLILWDIEIRTDKHQKIVDIRVPEALKDKINWT